VKVLEILPHDFPIRLQSGPVGAAFRSPKEVRTWPLTPSAVERAPRTQTRQQEVGIGIFGVRITDGDDFAIALQQDFVGTLAAIAEVDLCHPVVTEGRVEDAARGIARDGELLDSAAVGNSEAGTTITPSVLPGRSATRRSKF